MVPLWEEFIMVIKVDLKETEYVHITRFALQYFQTSALLESAIRRADIDKL